MLTYVYIVKCPECEDEYFDFFDEAKDFAQGCLSKKPIITQTEVNRNDFGECTDSTDLGTVWSWEDMMKDVETEDTKFSKAETFGISEGLDDFDDFDIGPQSDEFDTFDNSLDFDIDEEVPTDAAQGSTEKKLKTWICYYDNNDVGTVEAETEDEALEKFESSYNDEFFFDSWDHDWHVEEVAEESCKKSVALGEDLEYEFKPTELQKAKAEVFKLNNIQRFKEDETLPQIYALYKELAAADPENKTSPSSGFHTTAEDFLDFYKRFTELRNAKEVEVGFDTERRDLVTGAALVKFKNTASRDKLMSEAFTKNFKKPIPEGMTIEQLVEEMEENEDTVECTWCNDLFDKSECRKEVDLGWLCSRCEMAIKSRGETLTFREGNYWDFLDEDLNEELSFEDLVKDSISHLTNNLGKDPLADDFTDDVIADIENNYDVDIPEDMSKYNNWCSAIACEVSRQVNRQLN